MFALLFSTCKSQTITINAAAPIGVAEEFEPLTDVPAPAISLHQCKKKPHQCSSALGLMAIACDSLLEKIFLHGQPNSQQKQPCVVLGRAITVLLGTMLAEGRCRADGQTTAVLPSSSTGQLHVPRAEPHVLRRVLDGWVQELCPARNLAMPYGKSHMVWDIWQGWHLAMPKQCLQREPKP